MSPALLSVRASMSICADHAKTTGTERCRAAREHPFGRAASARIDCSNARNAQRARFADRIDSRAKGSVA